MILFVYSFTHSLNHCVLFIHVYSFTHSFIACVPLCEWGPPFSPFPYRFAALLSPP